MNAGIVLGVTREVQKPLHIISNKDNHSQQRFMYILYSGPFFFFLILEKRRRLDGQTSAKADSPLFIICKSATETTTYVQDRH